MHKVYFKARIMQILFRTNVAFKFEKRLKIVFVRVIWLEIAVKIDVAEHVAQIISFIICVIGVKMFCWILMKFARS